MRLLRTMMRDRSSAGAIAALAALLFLAQGLVGGFAHGSMLAKAHDPLQVICGLHGTENPSDSQHQNDGKADQCCTAACRIVSMASHAILATPDAVAPVRSASLETASVAQTAIPQSQRRRLLAQPRAPPFPEDA